MNNTSTIALVDDDDILREALKDQLSLHDEFTIITFDTARKAIDALKTTHVDLCLFDVGLPDIDGREAVKILRKNGFNAPIIMLTGHDSDSDAILGLDSGANDYVTKPFKIGVLMARIRAHLRQYETSEDAIFQIGGFSFQPGAKLMLDAKGVKTRLTDKETAILRYLHRNNAKPIARETLLAEVWGYNSGVTTHTLETHIYRLRQKIEQDPSSAKLLVTEGGGYRLAL